MDIRSFISEVARGYSRSQSMDSPIQLLLRHAKDHLSASCPAGLTIKGSGGKAKPTFTPWVGFFDPDVTTSPQRGIYVCLLFAEDMRSVALSLQQGIEELSNTLGRQKARIQLSKESDAIRQQLASVPTGWSGHMDLGSGGYRQSAYQAGNILAKTFAVSELPDEATLNRDLSHSFDLYAACVEAKRGLLQRSPGLITTGVSLDTERTDPLRDFKPKSSAEYVSHINGATLTKSRRHESIVADYGTFVARRGYIPSTSEHPKDLVLRGNGPDWLVEVKVVYGGNASHAVRAAIGQLFSYRYFLCDDDTVLLAVFSEPIGDGFVALLASLNIEAAWWLDGHWFGSNGAMSAGLAELSGVGSVTQP